MIDSFEKRIVEACRKYKSIMQEVCKNVSPANHAIYPSEMLAVCALCADCSVDLIIESGRQFGYSTNILAEWFKEKETTIVSIDLDPPSVEAKERLLSYGLHIELLQGDGSVLIQSFVEVSDGPCVVLMDGPKYEEALKVIENLRECRETDDLVKWFFIHDMVDWKYQEWAKEQEVEVFITNSKEFKDNFSDLDYNFLTELGFSPDSPGGGLAVIHSLD